MYVHVCMCACVCICVFLCVFEDKHVHAYLCMHVCVMCMYMFKCLYVYAFVRPGVVSARLTSKTIECSGGTQTSGSSSFYISHGISHDCQGLPPLYGMVLPLILWLICASWVMSYLVFRIFTTHANVQLFECSP